MRWKTQSGNVVSSHSSACGRSSLTTKLWIDSRSWSCSSVKMKCLREPAWSGFRTSVAAMAGTVPAGAGKVNSGTSHFPPRSGSRGIMRRVVPRLSVAVLLARSSPSRRSRAPRTARRSTIAHDGSLRRHARRDPLGLLRRRPARRGDPLAARYPGTYETFEVTVPEGTRHSRLEAGIGWKDKRIDLDLYVYRLRLRRPRRTAPAIARSAAKASRRERAVYAPSGATVEPGRYLVVVDNVCSRDADTTRAATGRADCGIGPNPPADEDDFEGTVTLGNQAPTVTLTGPASVRAKETATFRADAERRRRHDQHLPVRPRRRRHLRARLRRHRRRSRRPSRRAGAARSASRCSTTRAPPRSRAGPSTSRARAHARHAAAAELLPPEPHVASAARPSARW